MNAFESFFFYFYSFIQQTFTGHYPRDGAKLWEQSNKQSHMTFPLNLQLTMGCRWVKGHSVFVGTKERPAYVLEEDWSGSLETMMPESQLLSNAQPDERGGQPSFCMF